jgi:regulator of protease activity HflC (stomatin/prohibitin superfamily)
MSRTRDLIVKDTHRALWYENGVLVRILEAGRYKLPDGADWSMFGLPRPPVVETVLVDMRERELTIKGQEILTADKVAIRVSIIVQFRVTDPKAAVHQVASYEDRLYSDVQLAARRSLASMSLEDILTNRNKLSGDISRDVTGIAARYGVAIIGADVKDLVFPGNLQEIMNKVLAAERTAEAQLVQARTAAEMRKIDAAAQAGIEREQAGAKAESMRLTAAAEAEALHARTQAEVAALRDREAAAQAYVTHPALLRVRELEAIEELGKSANARIYIGFKKHEGED